MKSRLTFSMDDMDGQSVLIRHGYLITYVLDDKGDARAEELLSELAYYGYIATEEEPYENGEPRTTKESCIKVRIIPSNKSKSETHPVTIQDYLEDEIHQKLQKWSKQYYMKIRHRASRTPKTSRRVNRNLYPQVG